jgi:CrcB protein
MTALGIAIGGALGALARYFFTLWTQQHLAKGVLGTIPLGTLIVNVAGSFLLALIVGLSLHGVLSPALRLAIGTGFVGAFTTFSTFELDAHLLIEEGRYLQTGIYVLGNLLLGYGALLLGKLVALRIGQWM